NRWKKKFLIARSEVDAPAPSKVLTIPKHEAPHTSHGPRRIGLLAHSDDKNVYGLLKYRFALQSLTDPEDGNPPLAILEFGELSLRLKDNQTRIEELTLINAMTLNPHQRYHWPTSY